MRKGRKIIVSMKNVISIAGSVMALLIGSGFATGQEISQYFVSYGYKGILGEILAGVLLTYVSISFITAGYREKFENTNDIYRYYGGDKVGTFYDFFSIVFIFLSYTVMIGGASATGQQHYGWPMELGGVILAIATIIVVLLGLEGIVDVIGKIGPAIIVIAITLGIAGIYTYNDQLPVAAEKVQQIVASGKILQASTNWVAAAGSYVGFCMLWLAAFLAGVGSDTNSEKEGTLGVVLGVLGFSIAIILVTLALILSVDTTGGSNIPNLILASEIHPILGNIFSVIIILGIFTTSVPLMWSVVARFFKEGTKKFKIATVVLVVIGAFIGLALDFDKLVNVVYVINGYVGILLFFIMLYKTFLRFKANKNLKVSESVYTD